MDTEQFRKAYTDYRKVEASVLSAQSSQWTLHAERFANSIDLATVKRPVFHVPYAGFAPVNTMETKKLYPKQVSKLMPLSSTFTVNPTEGTERLFLDQWHQGLGLPTIMDDKAVENFKITQKRQFVDNFRSVMENTRTEQFKNADGEKIIALCRNFLAAIGTSNSKGPLLRISQEVYDNLVKVNQQLSPQTLTAIYDAIQQITNKKDSGKLDIRIHKEQSATRKDQASPVEQGSVQQTKKSGGALTDRSAAAVQASIPKIPNQGAPVKVDGVQTGPGDRPPVQPVDGPQPTTIAPGSAVPDQASPTDPASTVPAAPQPPPQPPRGLMDRS